MSGTEQFLKYLNFCYVTKWIIIAIFTWIPRETRLVVNPRGTWLRVIKCMHGCSKFHPSYWGLRYRKTRHLRLHWTSLCVELSIHMEFHFSLRKIIMWPTALKLLVSCENRNNCLFSHITNLNISNTIRFRTFALIASDYIKIDFTVFW